MSAHFTTPTDELLLLAETLGEVKTKADKLEAEFATQARPLEAATNALSAALSGIKALQFHVLDNNLGALSARVEEMRKAVDEQVGVIALELKKADETNAAKAGQEAEALRSEIAALQAQLGTLGAQFSAQLERVEFSAKEEAKKLQLIPGPAGAAGASLNPRGTFIDGETYNRLDVVSWLGSSYIASVDGVTEKPSKNSNQWQVLASRGGGAAGGAADFGSLAGVAQINQGGTGQTTRAAGLNALLPDQTGATQYMLLTDGAGNVSWGAQPVAGLPSQTGNSGKLLTTNGTSASWSNAVTVSGNNATVTGTLTANGLLSAAGATTLDGLPTSAVFGGTKRVVAGYSTSSDYGFLASVEFGAGWKDLWLNPSGGSIKAGGQLIQVADPATIALWKDATPTKAARFQFNTLADNGFSLGVYDGSSWFNAITVAPTTGVVKIPSSSASSSTITGALVVSGGVGIGGSLNAGANNAANSITGGDSGSGTYILQLKDGGGNLKVNFKGNGDVNLQSSTASTTTSSGALVVSGGVGVAGAINCGSGLVANPLFTQTRKLEAQIPHTVSTEDYLRIGSNTGSTNTYAGEFGYGLTAGGSPQIRFNRVHAGTVTTWLTVPTSTGDAEFAGSVKTAAPSGGTASAWKLGTVATVSPTSPNRTIEVDIGGTIYYIHAKTTNN